MAFGTRELKLLDTHVWVWTVIEREKVSRHHEELMSLESNQTAVSIVSCWEISMLVSKGRLKLGVPVADWFEKIIAQSGIEVLPLTPRITADAFALPGTFHGDPADKLIVATARDRDCELLTVDSKILKYPHVRTA